ncbi:MAG: N-acetylmuramoyl-L-alanine amidase [Chloroflexota bacterium]|nr:N-acetylmuramoyl-L-alanine amidase [Chloroflexota bacterium]MDQ5866497.1 N-acetylmuramoyl-L-alanine amidase [Chloroflexota bacterium]
MQNRSLYVVTGLFLLLVTGGLLGVLFMPRAESGVGGAAPTSEAGASTVLSVGVASPTLVPNGTVPLVSAATSATAALPQAEGESAVVAQATVAATPPPTNTPIPPPTNTPTEVPPPPTVTQVPLLEASPERIGGPVPVPLQHDGPRWVSLQVGHWRNENLPEELKHLDGHTGAFAGGLAEVDVNLAVARLTSGLLQERGYQVEILDATVPVSYTTDLFIAIHADGRPQPGWRGFKAVAPWDSVPASEKFVDLLYEEYGKATGLPVDVVTTDSMADYYAFSSVRYRHAITPGVPAALLEMGFVTNAEDRKVLSTRQDSIAWGIANAVDRWFRSGAAGPVPTQYATFTPTSTATGTPTSTATETPTATMTPTETPTALPTELVEQATQTAALTTPQPPTATPTLPRPTATPSPTATPLRPIITEDGRWLPPLALNGRNFPMPGSKAPPVYLSEETQYVPLGPDGREVVQVWEQFYVPELGRSIWKKGPVRYVRQ